MYFHVNGDLVPAEEATVSVRDRGFRYGDAAFETLRAYGGTVFEWERHADRLADTCEALALEHGLDRSDLRARVRETLAANDLADAYVRLAVSRGVQPGTLTPDPDVDPTVVVEVQALPRGGVDGESVWDGPATCALVDVQRTPDDAVPAHAKTHSYLNGVLARQAAPEADEALTCDADGFLAEGAASNLFFVREGTLHTPALDGPVLPGITRRVVLELAEERDLDAATGNYPPAALADADEAFLTNTTWEVRPVAAVDGDRVGGGPVTEALARAFDERVEQRHY